MSKLPQINRKIVWPVLFAVILVVIGLGLYVYRKPQKLTYQNNQYSFKHDARLSIQSVDTDSTRISSQTIDDDFSFVIERQAKISKAAGILRQSPIDLLISNIRSVTAKTYPNSKEVYTKKFNLDGKDAAHYVFTYTSPKDERTVVKQQVLIVVSGPDTAYTVRLQAFNAVFDDLYKKYFQEVFDSFKPV